MKTGNGMIQTGNGIISPIFWLPIKKTFFYKMFLTFNNDTKTGLKTGNGIMQTGNGIISSISWFLIPKLLLENVSKFSQGV